MGSRDAPHSLVRVGWRERSRPSAGYKLGCPRCVAAPAEIRAAGQERRQASPTWGIWAYPSRPGALRQLQRSQMAEQASRWGKH